VPWVHPAAGVHLDALLDNIRSAWNVGSMFRTADGLGICQLYLCGITPSPNNPKVLKTSLGAERNVVWTYEQDGVKAAQTLLERGRHLWALEQEARAVPLLEIERQALPQSLVLVVGNEIGGVDPGILELCEQVVSIPMLGAKRSLNAAVAFGITVHYLNSLSK
jgi:tRNA G18 (ribose-2'-O)-methylase SpoU